MQETKDTERVTIRTYGFLWDRSARDNILCSSHFNTMQEVIPEGIVRGKIGVEVGAGCGCDTFVMAKDNPNVKILSLDLSEGVYSAKRLCSQLGNVMLVRGSAINLPLKENSFDFAYSFGVLHHITIPEIGLKELGRVIRKDAPVFIYLYEDHADNRFKRMSIQIVNLLRRITTRVPPKILYLFSYLLSPMLILIFSMPARGLARFKTTRSIAEKMPFNFGTHLFSIVGDIYDRFGAPIEHRFSRQQVHDMLEKLGFYKISITKLKGLSGWVAWGYKNKC